MDSARAPRHPPGLTGSRAREESHNYPVDVVRRDDIEGLRALAVAAVLLFHFGVPGTEGGFIGVDVFFVISGFLITGLLISERESSGRISLVGFYARRARRILPVSTVVLAATAVASAVWLEPSRLGDLAVDIAGAAFFGANIVFGDRGADYLTANLPDSPVLHYWSLAVEEQFYMVWPALLALAAWRSTRPAARMIAAVFVVVVGSLAASVMLTPAHPSWSYYGLHTRAWELALGALLALGWTRVVRIPAPLRGSAGWIGVLAVVVSTFLYGGAASFPGWIALGPVVATVLAIASGDDNRWGPTRFLSLAPLRWMGTRSFSLYLWHWPALVIAESRAGNALTAGQRIAVLAGVVLAAELGHRVVEQPVRHARRLVADPGLSLLLGAVLVASGTLTSVLLWRHEPSLATGSTVPPPSLVTTTSTPADSVPAAVEPAPVSNASDRVPDAVTAAAESRTLPDNLSPTLGDASADLGPHYRSPCWSFSDTDLSARCVLGDPDSDVVVALWGDSHAAQWASPLAAIAERRGWALHLMTRGGCGYMDVVTWNFLEKRAATFCTPWRTAAERELVARGVDVVFVSQYLGTSAADTRRLVPVDTWLREHERVVERLSARGIEVVLIGDSPNPPRDTPACLSANRRDIRRCAPVPGGPRDEALITGFADIARRTRSGHLDTHRWLCAPRICPAVVGNLLVYRDNNHVSDTFARWLEPLLAESIVTRTEWIAGR